MDNIKPRSFFQQRKLSTKQKPKRQSIKWEKIPESYYIYVCVCVCVCVFFIYIYIHTEVIIQIILKKSHNLISKYASSSCSSITEK